MSVRWFDEEMHDVVIKPFYHIFRHEVEVHPNVLGVLLNCKIPKNEHSHLSITMNSMGI